jgi:hypothetical protein
MAGHMHSNYKHLRTLACEAKPGVSQGELVSVPANRPSSVLSLNCVELASSTHI